MEYPPLKGLIFSTSPKDIRPEGIQGLNRVRADELPFLEKPSFIKKIEKHFGQPANMATLDEVIKEVVLCCRKNDLPVIDPQIPEQDITSGTIQILILKGKVGEVSVTGNKWFKAEPIRSAMRLKNGDEIRSNQMQEDIDWINSNPFRSVQAVFSKGQEFATTDIELKTADRFPVRPFVGYEDSGNDLTGDERIIGGFEWGNAFGQQHLFSYQYTGAPDPEMIRAHSGSYTIPLPWRHKLSISGSYADTKADIANPLFDLQGYSWQLGLRYAIPLPRFQTFRHEVSLGCDFKQSNNNLQFGGQQVFDTMSDINQWVLSYSASLPDSWGATSISATYNYSPGAWTSKNHDLQFSASRAFSDSNYMYAKATLDRVTQLPLKFTWGLSGTIQRADGNLLGSEQIGAGGYASVRGYEEREANGDEGFLLRNELRTPPASLLKWIFPKIQDQFQLLAFYDYGLVENIELLPGEDPTRVLRSVGPGARYTVGNYVSFRFDYGWQLQDSDTGRSQFEGINTPNSRGHLGVSISY